MAGFFMFLVALLCGVNFDWYIGDYIIITGFSFFRFIVVLILYSIYEKLNG